MDQDREQPFPSESPVGYVNRRLREMRGTWRPIRPIEDYLKENRLNEKKVMKIGWSDFALKRHHPGAGYSYFMGSDEELFQHIRDNWGNRKIGAGAKSIDDVCLVSVPPDGFVGTKVRLEDAQGAVEAVTTRRQDHEAPFVKLFADGPTVPVKHVQIVLYAAHELEKNDGKRSGDFDWEIVCIIASDVEDEPMTPLAMARNQLEMPGGTPRQYSSEEWARAVWYWSQFVTKK